MKTACLAMLTFLLSITTLFAQSYRVEKSLEFAVTEPGWNKLLQLKNGNTLFFHANFNEGIEVIVYDKARKQLAKQTITSDKWSANLLPNIYIRGLYEINGEAVLFLYEFKKEPVLCRIRINGENGAFIKEDDLAHLDLPTLGWKNVLNDNRSYMTIDKDPVSDHYAVTICDYNLKGPVIKVDHYDGTHKKINEISYITPPGFNYVKPAATIVDGANAVYLLGRAFYGGKTVSKLFLSRAGKDEKLFKHVSLYPSEEFKDLSASMFYNHGNDKIQVITVTLASSKHHMMTENTTYFYETALSSIDPTTLAVTSTKPLGVSKATAYAYKHIDNEYNFAASTQGVVLNKDNTITLLMEEEKTIVAKSSTNTTLGAIGISELSADGDELNGYVMCKKQEMNISLPSLFMCDKVRKAYNPDHSELAIMSYDYINTGKARYILFNDVDYNFEKDENEKKRKTMYPSSNAATLCYALNDNSITRSFVFGQEMGNGAAYAHIQSSDFNQETGTYAVLITEPRVKGKNSHIAWVNFD